MLNIGFGKNMEKEPMPIAGKAKKMEEPMPSAGKVKEKESKNKEYEESLMMGLTIEGSLLEEEDLGEGPSGIVPVQTAGKVGMYEGDIHGVFYEEDSDGEREAEGRKTVALVDQIIENLKKLDEKAKMATTKEMYENANENTARDMSRAEAEGEDDTEAPTNEMNIAEVEMAYSEEVVLTYNDMLAYIDELPKIEV